MIRARITVGGKVQRVGYREKVQEIARELGIAGKVQNLKSGEVEIICEGEKQNVEDFIKAIEIRDGLIEVKKITRTFEEPIGEFKHFEIGYGEVQEELTESIGAGRRELIAIRETLGEKIDTGFSKMDSNFQTLGGKVDAAGKNLIEVGGKIDAGFSKMDSNFHGIDSKYDVVSKELKSINANISRLADYSGGLLAELVKKKKPKAGVRKKRV